MITDVKLFADQERIKRTGNMIYGWLILSPILTIPWLFF